MYTMPPVVSDHISNAAGRCNGDIRFKGGRTLDKGPRRRRDFVAVPNAWEVVFWHEAPS